MKIALFRQKVFANQHSIRWRLPLSYAGIALLTAVALSGLLLFTLRSYYSQREKEYLQVGARMLARQTEHMYRDQLSAEEIQSSTNLLSFLVRARVQLLDEEMQIVADSGPVSEQNLVNVSFSRPGNEEPPDANAPGEAFGPYLSVPPESNTSQIVVLQGQDYRYPLPAQRDPFGQFLSDETVPGKHSSQRVITPVYGSEGEVVGYVELSEGPAFGSAIVADVAEKSAVAGVIAVLIAAVAGVIVSRGISHPVRALAEVTQEMAQGNLAARVNLERRDEFGLLAKTFNIMAERVEATVNTLRQFVEDAAHEINTPLTALRTNLELTATDDIPDTVHTDIEQALTELARLEKLTRNLLTLARLEAPDTLLQRTTLDLALMIRQMHERYASRAEQAGITFTAVAPEQPVFIQADQAQITRMFDNLLDNALKFTLPLGQVTLGIRVEQDRAHLWVQDTGIGIPESDLPKLFSRFHRGRNAAAFPGNGLGLVITKAIVEEHGGQITVKSDSSGTCFTVDLPLSSG